jgi:hypothetical protein
MRKKILIKKNVVYITCGCDCDKSCKLCKGVGKRKDFHYIISDGKIAIDGDTLK